MTIPLKSRVRPPSGAVGFSVLAYVSLVVPAVIAGILVSTIGVRHDAVGYAAVAAILAVAAMLAQRLSINPPGPLMKEPT